MRFLFLLALMACVSSNDRMTLIKMDVFYGALCPDSTVWFSQVFGPLYHDFRVHLNVTLVPFGKSRVRNICCLNFTINLYVRLRAFRVQMEQQRFYVNKDRLSVSDNWFKVACCVVCQTREA